MKCILCGQPADKQSLYIPGKESTLIVGNAPEGGLRSVLFGICSNHLDDNGDFKEGIELQVKQAILRRVREPGVPNITIGDE